MRAIPNTAGIYAIRHCESGKLYVGSSINLRARLSRHRTNLRGMMHGNKHLQNAWNKYGEKAFQFCVLELVTDRAQLTLIEQTWIDKLNAIASGFNKRPVAATNLGIKLSEETRRKIALANKGRRVSEATREKLRQANTGKHHSPETRAKLSIVFSGMNKGPKSAEHRHKLSLAHVGKTLSAEHRRKLSESHKGIPQSEESRAKKSAALSGRKKSVETRARMSLGQLARYV